MTTKYQTLLTILDEVRKEAPPEYRKYRPIETDSEKVDQARSKAFIHLFLKVQFGIFDFKERENYITDGANDGGIDAYYIDQVSRKIYFIQSKFRTTEATFDKKLMDADEIIRMDVDRIAKGKLTDENGERYNSKILALIRNIQNIEGIARYNYVVVLLANVKPFSPLKLRRLLGDFQCEIYNFERCYKELVFPVVTGTYYNASDLYIDIDLSNKPYSQSRIRYAVNTEFTDCEITLLFVPTLEIAKNMYKYRNSILKFNPRTYLGLSHSPVNQEIAKTITEKTGNEFSLFNNGITMLSDETRFNESTGKEYWGQLHVKNPQIINGGQTAYTLSEIYEQSMRDEEDLKAIFGTKEVMLKVITLIDANRVGIDIRRNLIEAISKATNQQITVNEADRRSNDRIQLELQENIYYEFGYFYERKRGEFYDGLHNKYINRDRVIDREVFLRVCYAISGQPENARRTSRTNLFKKESFDEILYDATNYRRMFFGYVCYSYLDALQKEYNKDPNNKFGFVNFGSALRYGKFAVVSVAHALLNKEITPSNIDQSVKQTADKVLPKWLGFEEYAKKQPKNRDYFRKRFNAETGEEYLEMNFEGYYKVHNVARDIEKFFKCKLRT
jgi:hypothetical protein